MQDPPGDIDTDVLDRIQGSIIGMAIGDALGAHVEFRPYEYMVANPVEVLESGGTWGLEIGQVRPSRLFRIDTLRYRALFHQRSSIRNSRFSLPMILPWHFAWLIP